MRGNETQYTLFGRTLRDEFPIPMRGNEARSVMVTGECFIVFPILWVANYYSARNPLRLSSLVILGVVTRMFRCATRSSCWCT